ncbi:MAG: agmatinase [Thermoplasmata archaeon]|nr:agmatinase [Thermoplasmata archaeon]MBE3137045.1 agmatinase [Thermoplasmata archaeon]MBE3139461.1 agmatinase [Thermoplasmata archaeon]
MDFPNYFADAESSFDDASFILFGVPFEKTSSFRHGADKAPYEVRQASWNFERYDLRTGINFEEILVHDYGDLDAQNLTSKEVFETTKTFTSKLLVKKKIPIAIGGDHSITPGIIAAFPKDIAVISLDAHMDFRQKYKNDIYNHACVIRRVADHIPLQNIAVLGIRSAEKEEYEQAQEQGLFFRDVFTINKIGIQKSIQQTKTHLKGKQIYLTLDIDVVDPAYAPGTSTPEPFGLTPLDVLEIIGAFSPQLIGCDVVEVCPPYDHGQTAVLAAKLVQTCISGIWRNREA